MGKHLLRLMCLFVAMCIGTQLYAQTPLVTADFEQGMPTTWTQEPATPTVGWSVSSNGLTGITAHGGSNYMSLYTTTSYGATKVVLPMVDASGVNSLELSFYRIAEARGAALNYARDTLCVYRRTSTTGAWVLTETYSAEATSWTKEVIDLSNLVTGNVQIAFEFRYGAGRGIALDDIRLGNASVCFTPNTLQSYRVNSTSATLMWNAYAAALSYNLKVSTTRLLNAATDAADVLDTTLYSKPYVLQGLTPSTTYYYYVSADCGDGDVSAWSAGSSFRTGCSEAALPYSDNFDATAAIDACWTVGYAATGEWGTVSTTSYSPTLNASTANVHSGTRSLNLRGYFNPSLNREIKAWAITRELAIANAHNTQVSFYVKGTAINQNLHVGLLSDVNDLSTFEEIGSVRVQQTSVPEEVILPMTNINGDGKYLCFYVDGTEFNTTSVTTVNFYIDDVEVAIIPACPKPSLLTTSHITDSSALVSWVGVRQNYRVAYSTVKTANPDTVAHVVNVANDTALLTNLAANTTYYWWVRSDCSASNDGMSVWSVQSSFKTQCGGISTLPWTENFNSYGAGNDVSPGCWISQSTMTSTTKVYPNVTDGATYGTGAGCLYVYATSGEKTMGSTPRFDIPINTLQITFTCGVATLGYNVKVGVCDDPNDFSTFTLIRTITPEVNGAAGQATYTVYFTNYTGTGKYISFLADRTGASTGAYIDDVVVDVAPTCIVPQTVNVTNITTSSAQLDWASMHGETQWNVRVNSRKDVDAVAFEYTNVTTPSLALTGLGIDKPYYIYMQSVCGTETTPWVYVDKFATECGDIVSLPWTEEFEHRGTGTSSCPACWTKVSSNGSYPYVYTSAMNHTPNGVDKGALYFSASTSSNRNLTLLPKIDVAGKRVQDMQLTLFGRYSNTSSSLVVGVMSDPADQTTFVAVDTLVLNAANVWQEYVISFANYTGNGQYIGFWDGHRAGSTNYFYIDDLTLELLPSCQRPNAPVASNYQETSVDLSWDPRGNEQQWEVAYYPLNGGSLATATRVIVNNSNPTINGLTASTDYECYVRAVCGANDTSEWSRPALQFRTRNAVETLPIVTSFDDAADNAKWALSNGAQANRWFIGTVEGNETTNKHSLYVSGDNGVTNGYINNSISFSYAYRTLRFLPGATRIEFDWKAAGESNYDFLRVFLAPTDAVLEGGVNNGITSATAIPTHWISLTPTKLNLSNNLWEHVVYDVSVSDTTDYNLVFFWKNDGSSGVAPSAAVDNVSVVPAACSTPMLDLTITDTQIGVDAHIFNGANSYELAASTAQITNMANPTGMFYHQTLTNTHVDFNNLTPQTTYYIYVRSFCSATDTSEWREYIVTTECSLAEAPYTCDFETIDGSGNINVPNCWHKPLVYSASSSVEYPYVATGASTAHSGTRYLYMYASSSTPSGVMSATPRFDIDSIQQYRAEFYMRYSTAGYSCIVGVLDNLNDPTSFVAIDTVYVDEKNVWEKKVVSFKDYTGNGKNVALWVLPGINGKSSGYAYIDDFSLVEDRMCQTPTNVAVSSITSTDARLSWDANNGLSFNVLVTNEPVKPDTITGDESCVILTADDLTDTYLEMDGAFTVNTTYYVYVMSDCQSADGKPSCWSRGVSFTTACLPVSVPYVEQFGTTRTGDNVLPTCWSGITEVAGDVPNGYRESPHCYKNAGTAYCGDPLPNDSTSLRMYAYYAAATSTESAKSTKLYAALPQMTGNMADYRLDMIYATTSQGGATMLVGVMSDPNDASTFYTIDTITGTSYWTPYALSLDKCVGHGDYVAFLVDGDLNQKTSIYYIDRLSVTPSTACTAPTNLRATNITGEGADITLNTVNAADSVVHIQVATVGLGTNVDYVDSLPADAILLDTIVNVNNLPVHLGGLYGNTTYYIYARTVCGTNPANYSPRYYRNIPFTTDCGKVALPYSYDFDDKSSTGSSVKPTCWTTYQSNGATNNPYVSTTNYSAPYGLYMYGTSSYVSYGVLPEIDVDSIQHVRLNLMLRNTSTSYNLQVGVMTDPTDTATFTLVKTIKPSASSTWEELEVEFANYTGNGKYIALRNGNSGTVYVDDVFVELATNCKRPGMPTIEAISPNSVTVSWAAGESQETVWDIVLCNKGAAIDADKAVRTTSNTFTFNNLRPNAKYDIYVRAVCDSVANTVSSWRGALSFKTFCDAVTVNDSLSFADDFDDYGTGAAITDIGCWVKGTNYTTTNYPYPSNTAHSGVASMYLYGASSTYSYMSTPEIVGSPLTDLRVKFWGRASSLVYKLKVGTMSNPLDYTSFTELEEIAVDATNTWKQYVVDLANYTGTDKYIAFMATTGATSYFFVDDVEVYKPGVCEAPLITYDALKYDSVAVHLNTMHPEVGRWEVVVTTGNNTTTGVVVDTITTSLDVVLTNLQPQTDYTVFTRTACGSGFGDWSVAQPLLTECAPVVVNDTLGFADDFEGIGTGSSIHPVCWTTGTNNTTAYPYLYGTTPLEGAASLYFYGSSTYYSYAATPRIEGTPLKEINVSFLGAKTSATSDYFVELGVMSDPNDYATFTTLYRVEVPTNTISAQHYSYNMASAAADAHYVAWRCPVGATNYFKIDSVSISKITGCAAPAVTVGGDTAVTTVTVVPVRATDNRFQVVITQGANPTAGGAVVDTVINGTSFSVANLPVNTPYSVYARTLCTNDTSEWSMPTTYRTPCAAVLVDFTHSFADGFDDYTTGVNGVMYCYTKHSTYNSTYPYCNTTNYSGSGSLFFYTGTANTNNFIALPQFNGLPTNQLRASFMARTGYTASELVIGAMTDVADVSTFVPVDTITLNVANTWTPFTIPFTQYQGNGHYVAFKLSHEGSTVNFFIDELLIEAIPMCAEPVVDVTNITATAATVELEPARVGDSQWQVKLGTTYDSEATATLLDTIVNTTTIPLSGLQSATGYRLFVRTICDTNETSPWTDAYFTTNLALGQLPIVSSFEATDSVANRQWLLHVDADKPNKWVIGNAVSNGGLQSLYVSDNNGTSASYSHTSEVAVAARAFHMAQTDSLLLAFDWMCQGESNFDFIRVFLAPYSYNLQNLSYSDITTTSVPAGWTSLTSTKLNLQSTWQHFEDVFNVPAGDYSLVFVWRNDASGGSAPGGAIDNVVLGTRTSYAITDTVCDGYNYTDNGFNIPSTDISATSNTFTRTNLDSIINLTLIIAPVSLTEYTDTICAGETYTQHGFNASASGVYNLAYNSVWGCDSIVRLNLTVNPVYNTTDQVTITESDLPYTYGDTVFNAGTQSGTYLLHYQTEAGCDSIITLNLNVTAVGLGNAEEGLFALSPNPAHRGEKVRVDIELPMAEREGMVVELFSNDGTLIERVVPTEQPIYITMPQVDGLYLVRVTTSTGKVYYGKVVVR